MTSLSSGWIVPLLACATTAAGQRTVPGSLTPNGRWSDVAVLLSGGDTSYPGIVRSGDSILVSYYSSHEGKTAIYLATLGLQ